MFYLLPQQQDNCHWDPSSLVDQPDGFLELPSYDWPSLDFDGSFNALNGHPVAGTVETHVGDEGPATHDQAASFEVGNVGAERRSDKRCKSKRVRSQEKSNPSAIEVSVLRFSECALTGLTLDSRGGEPKSG